jgi:hypothetical protein
MAATAEERINTIWLEPESPSVPNTLMFNINNTIKKTSGIRASKTFGVRVNPCINRV